MLERLMHRDPHKPRGLLAGLLESYPAYVAPFPGDPAKITEEQARANLDALLAQKQARLALIRAVLARFDIDFDAGLAAIEPDSFFKQIDRWAVATWPDIGGNDGQERLQHELRWLVRQRLRSAFPAVADQELISLKRWRSSDRAGADIFYSLLLDLSLALGEVAMRRRPEIYWGLDLTIRAEDDRAEYHVPVLRGVRVPDSKDDPSCEEAYALEPALFLSFADICTTVTPDMCEPTRYLRGMISDYAALRRHATRS
ncbi:MAG TPA: hypothetical protein VGI32_10710 [Steroidobacteraceae bacterium]|jgi:hypothetical protein